MDWNAELGQIITFFMMAVALGMDAFSMGIGIGMQKLSWLQIMKISITIGIFHFFMPFIGIVTGHYLLGFIGNVACIMGGGLLILLGANMLWSSIFGTEVRVLNQTNGIGLFILAFSVSIDALSVGFSLGLFSAHLWLVTFLFGIVGAVMTIFGLSLGSQIGNWVGDYGEAFGGIILLVFGFKFLV